MPQKSLRPLIMITAMSSGSSSSSLAPPSPARWAEPLAISLALVEILSIFIADVPVGVGLVFALLFGLTAYLLRRGHIAGVVLLLLLSLIEVVGFFGYSRDDAGDWILQIAALLLGILGVVAGVALLRSRRAS